jgi:hypothetical protein
MKKRLQIDVKGPTDINSNIMDCNLYIDGRCCKIYMSRSNYEALMYDGIFIRDGLTKDSTDVINTTNIFEEQG